MPSLAHDSLNGAPLNRPTVTSLQASTDAEGHENAFDLCKLYLVALQLSCDRMRSKKRFLLPEQSDSLAGSAAQVSVARKDEGPSQGRRECGRKSSAAFIDSRCNWISRQLLSETQCRRLPRKTHVRPLYPQSGSVTLVLQWRCRTLGLIHRLRISRRVADAGGLHWS